MFSDELKQKIIDKVCEYANKHRDCWGIDEYVWQNDEAQLDGINLFSKLISLLPCEEEEDDD